MTAQSSPSAYLVVANSDAGTHDREAVAAAADMLRGSHASVDVATTEDPTELDGVLADCEGRTVVAAGGDGSVHAIANALERLGLLAATPLGLLPLGTGNDLARTAGVPADPADAASLLVSGTPRPTDIIRSDLGLVVNASHAGLGAEASAASLDLKPKLGRAAYPVGALVAAVRESGWKLSVEVDGEALTDGSHPTLLAGVGNGRTIGGGTPLFPGARLDDGRLDVVVSHAVGPKDRIGFASALRNGDHVERDDVTVMTGHRVVMSGEPTRHSADGEITDERSEATFELLPAAWKLIRP